MSGSWAFARNAVVVRAITACSAALVCLGFALSTASSALAAPYPPTSPCAVTAWRNGPLAADGSADYSVTGTGLGPSLPVRLLLASRTVLGQTRTDQSGGFAAHVRAPRGAAGGEPITAATAQQTCDSGPPTVNPSSPTGGNRPSGAVTAPGAAAPGVTATGAPGVTASTNPSVNPSANPSGTASLGAPVTGGPSGSPTGPTGPTGPTRPSRPAPRAEPGITHAISAYIGLIIAAVLLVLGTLAVLLFTRRAGH